MKTFASLFFVSLQMIVFPNAGRTQQNRNLELSRYSYPIFAVEGGQQYTGTAFFYKTGDLVYLVSNYHTIKGMSPMKQAITFNTDTLFLKYPVKNSSHTRILPIDISEAVTGATEIFSMVDRIDLMKIAINPPADADIRFINELIDPVYLDQVPEELVIFGFPTGAGSVPEFYSRQQRLNGNMNPDGFTEYDESLKLSVPGASDSARAIIGNTARYYYFLKPYTAQGYSGAPVFGKFRTADNTVIYRFAGVIFAGQPLTRQTWAIRGEVALDYLQN